MTAVANLFERLDARRPALPGKENGANIPEPAQLPVTIPRGPLLQTIVPPTDHRSPPIEKLLDWLVNRWPKPSVRVREICQFGPPAARNRKSAIALAELLAANGWLTPLKTRRHDMKMWQIVRGPHEPPRTGDHKVYGKPLNQREAGNFDRLSRRKCSKRSEP